MLPLKTETLRYQLKHRPATVSRDMSHAPVSSVVKALNTYMTGRSHERPESEAIRFYLWNHAVSATRAKFHEDEPLGEHLKVLTGYHENMVELVPRMFYYLLLITTRESRHAKKNSSLGQTLAGYPPALGLFHGKIQGKGSSGAVDRFRSEPPKMPLGQYTQALVDLFYKCNYSGGYGGKAWGAIADCLNEFVHGRYTAEMMLDTAFTLCHNNGPIFNKGMLYDHYDSIAVVKILDVQRSGQIPKGVDSEEIPFITPRIKQDHKMLKPLVGSEFSGYVDWYAVEALGGLGSYHNEKSTQLAKHGASPLAAQMEKLAADKKAQVKAEAKAKAEAAKKAKLEEEKMYYYITPTEKVKKAEVVRNG